MQSRDLEAALMAAAAAAKRMTPRKPLEPPRPEDSVAALPSQALLVVQERAAMRDSATQTEAEENPDASSAITEVGKGVGNVAAWAVGGAWTFLSSPSGMKFLCVCGAIYLAEKVIDYEYSGDASRGFKVAGFQLFGGDRADSSRATSEQGTPPPTELASCTYTEASKIVTFCEDTHDGIHGLGIFTAAELQCIDSRSSEQYNCSLKL